MAKFNRPKPPLNNVNNETEEVFEGSGFIKKKRKFNRGSVLPDNIDLGGLSGKERAFVSEYIKDYNGTQAAIRAKYAVGSASWQGHKLLRKTKIIEAINAYEKDLDTRFINTKEKVLKEMSLLAHSDISDYLTENGEIRVTNLRDLPPQVTRAIKKVRIHTVTRRLARDSAAGLAGDEIVEKHIDFELYDKKGALDRMGQELGIFKDTKALTGPDGQSLIPQGATKVVFDFGVEDA